MTQDTALAILKTGANVFLTGEPGAGKTHTVNAYVRYLREHNIQPSITASTGIAATHVGGMTIHSWSGIAIRKFLSEQDLDQMGTNEKLVKRLRGAKVLIIDEVSMLDAGILNMVEQVCRALRHSEEAFGGIQVVLVGDFFQLPPVARYGEPRPIFAFAGDAWAALKPVVCYLSEQHRQDDFTFLATLASIRRGDIDEGVYETLRERHTKPGEHPTDIPELFTHNVDVDQKNQVRLASIGAEERVFRMESKGRASLIEAMKKSCLSPEILALKKDAAVMFTRNNFDAGYVNGTLGEICGFDADTGYPEVRTREGRIITAVPEEWSVEDNGKVLASLKQIPLRLAWAITVHKSQGMSMDAAVMNLSGAFEYGQGYVALSRVRTLRGVHLLGINPRALEVHPEVLTRDGGFRIESAKAEEAFTALGGDALVTMHHNFIRASGGVLEAVKVKPSVRSFEQKIPTMDITKKFILDKKSLGEIAEERGLTVGTIVSHAIDLLARGDELDLSHWIDEFGIEKFDRIMAAFAKTKDTPEEGRLTPVRAILKDEFSFDDIRLAKLLSGEYPPEPASEKKTFSRLREEQPSLTRSPGSPLGREPRLSSGGSSEMSKEEKHAAMREKFPNMGGRWTPEEEERLRASFAAGKKTSVIASEFGRKPGGIRARLKKLGLIDD